MMAEGPTIPGRNRMLVGVWTELSGWKSRHSVLTPELRGAKEGASRRTSALVRYSSDGRLKSAPFSPRTIVLQGLASSVILPGTRAE